MRVVFSLRVFRVPGRHQRMTQWISTLTELAQQAGAITLKYFQSSGLAVESKADESPVTVADRLTEEFLRGEIAKRFPGDAVLGEEFGTDEGTANGRRWIIDPIDGTKSFIHGVPLYGVMIGLEIDGRLDAGVVAIPAMNEIVVAARGEGCWWNGKRAAVSSTSDLSKALILTTDHASHAKHGRARVWDTLTQRARLVRTWGDCYGHLLVATGRAEVMVDPIMSPWDCAALLPIVQEAGGSFTDYRGEATAFGSCAISVNAALKEEVLSIAAEG